MTQSPPFMYQEIMRQPQAVQEVLARNEAPIRELAEAVKERERIILVGIGSSLHAARLGVYMAREANIGVDVYAFHSFDFVNYTPPLRPSDLVIGISHRGTKTFSVEALRIARDAGCFLACITGMGGETPLRKAADITIESVDQERSSAHTVSLMGSMAVLHQLVTELAQPRIEANLPQLVHAGLDTSRQLQKLAEIAAECRKIWLTGGGPGAVLAEEGALKILETSYRPAEGLSVESLLHGPFASASERDMFVIIGPGGRSLSRLQSFVPMIDDIGAKVAGIGFKLDSGTAGHHVPIDIGDAPEPTAAFATLVSLQLFSYYLSQEAGTDPDAFRLDDDRFKRALSRLEL